MDGADERELPSVEVRRLTVQDQLAVVLEVMGGARGTASALGTVDRRMVQRWAKGREIPEHHALNIKATYRRILQERLVRRVEA